MEAEQLEKVLRLLESSEKLREQQIKLLTGAVESQTERLIQLANDVTDKYREVSATMELMEVFISKMDNLQSRMMQAVAALAKVTQIQQTEILKKVQE